MFFKELMYLLSALSIHNNNREKNRKKIISEHNGNIPTPVIFSR